MKRILAGILLMLGFAMGTQAQTLTKSFSHDFTFGPNTSATCSPIVTWDGVADAYPLEMGQVCYGSDYFGASITAPFQLGFLNNGDLSPCDQMHPSSPVFISGNAITGGIYVVTGSTTCPYFTGEYGTDFNSNNRLDGFNVVITYKLTAFKACRFGRCSTYYTHTVQDGSGTVTDWIIIAPTVSPAQP